MNLRRKAAETLDGVKEASSQVIETTSWATVALVAVSAIAVLALGIGIYALGRANAAT